jgi:hypothetical protein
MTTQTPPRKMSDTEIDVSDFFNDNINFIRVTPDYRIAAIDLVMIVTGQSNNNSAKTIKRMEDESTPFWSNIEKYQFKGRGQQKIYVLKLSEASELIGMLPGSKAKKFRRHQHRLYTRVYAGDPTLHDFIIKNGLSDHPLNQIARAEMADDGDGIVLANGEQQLAANVRMALMTQQLATIERETVASKGRAVLLELENGEAIALLNLRHGEAIAASKGRTALMELENGEAIVLFQAASKGRAALLEMQLETQLKDQRTKDRLKTADEVSALCTVGLDETGKMWYKESTQNYKLSIWNTTMGLGTGVAGEMSDDMESVTITNDILKPRNIVDTGNTIAKGIGLIAGKMYAAENQGIGPPKERAHITTSKGASFWTPVNKYFKKDMPLLEAAYCEYERINRVTEQQKAAKEQKAKDQADANEEKAQKAKDKAKEQADAKKEKAQKAKDKADADTRARQDKEIEKAEKDLEKKEKEKKKDQGRNRKSALAANQPSMRQFIR